MPNLLGEYCQLKFRSITFCLITIALFTDQLVNCQQSQSAQSPENELMLQVAQKLLSNIDNFPEAISDGISGNPNGIRRLVTSALGNGLIGRLVENPLEAASRLGLDVEQLGLNRTFLERYLGKFGLAQLARTRSENELPEKPKHENYFTIGNDRNGDDDAESTLVFGGKKHFPKNSLHSPFTELENFAKSSLSEKKDSEKNTEENQVFPLYEGEYNQEKLQQQNHGQTPLSDYWANQDLEKRIFKRSNTFTKMLNRAKRKL